jgi:hypothetical protein
MLFLLNHNHSFLGFLQVRQSMARIKFVLGERTRLFNQDSAFFSSSFSSLYFGFG